MCLTIYYKLPIPTHRCKVLSFSLYLFAVDFFLFLFLSGKLCTHSGKKTRQAKPMKIDKVERSQAEKETNEKTSWRYINCVWLGKQRNKYTQQI